MSPRRKVEAGAELLLAPPPRRWGLPLAVTFAAAAAITAMAVSAVVLSSHEMQRRTTISDAVALSFVRSFMTDFTSPDPLHANDYADRVLDQATGDFAEQYRQNENEILIGVARSEPTTGAVLEAGVSRRNDDGSVEVLVITKFTSKSPDGKLQAERADRWKISSLIPMI
jgi:Mce-associated membrane protein